MNATNLPASLRKYAKQIAEVSDERSGGDGYWVYLKPGLRYSMDGTHCIHEDTLGECAKAMKYVEPCDGDCCK
jgi:hypothetical protein